MTTFVDALEQAIEKAGTYYQGDVDRPACILWPDGTGEWRLAAQALAQRRTLFTLGRYDPVTRTGPAIWLRTLIDLNEGAPPVVYLPGVSRDDLRTDDAPADVTLLVELQYRGNVFERRDHKDWTVASFLNQQEYGLGIEVAAAARPVVAGHLETLLGRTVKELKQRAPLTSTVLDQLSYPDLPGELLRWLSEPDAPVSSGLRTALENEFGVDLSAGAATVAAKLAGRAGHLLSAWERYVQTPDLYPGVQERLAAAGPTPDQTWTLEQAEVWPQVNEYAEQRLETALRVLHGQASAQVREGIVALEDQHGPRRDFVWTKLGQSPLAGALAPLAELANASTGTLGDGSLQELAQAYAERGYLVDQAAIAVLGCASSESQRQVLAGTLRAPYLEWLERVNGTFAQAAQMAGAFPLPTSHGWTAAPGLAVIFVDGLRYDLAAQLATLLNGEHVQLDWQFSAVPTITKTAKPAVAPVGGLLEPLDRQQLTLSIQGKAQTAATLRDQLTQRGFVPVFEEHLSDPSGAVWLERGDFDSMGHAQGLRLASRVADELSRLRENIVGLLAHGFREVRVITDHGWLLLPGGLQKVELPGSLTLFKKGRCAVLKEGNTSDYATFPWTWDNSVAVTLAPTVNSFEAGETYTHGGLSLQESVIPLLTVRREGAPVQVVFTAIRWVNNRCKVEVSGGTGLNLDLRRKATDPHSSLLTSPKVVGPDGQVSLLVSTDDVMGEAALLVALRDGQVVRQQSVIVGDEG